MKPILYILFLFVLPAFIVGLKLLPSLFEYIN